MRKSLNKIFFLLFYLLLFQNSIFGQNVIDDFEGNGTINSWYGFDCNFDNNFPNPHINTLNNSSKVLQYKDQGGLYAHIRFETIIPFDLSIHHTFSFKIYVPSSGLTGNQTQQISLKLQDGSLNEPWTTQTEIIKSIVLDQWQTMTFNFENDTYYNLSPDSPAPIDRTDLDRVLIQINGENNTDHVEAYIDDFFYDGMIIIPNTNTEYTHLVWSDEFDNDGTVDPEKWYHQTQLPNGESWYNNEVQHYTDRIENSEVIDGHLYITAKKETYTDQGQTKQYTSARLNSKFAFTYGKVEVRAKLPTGMGTWPAIWTLGTNINENGGYWSNISGNVSWPACGEIDIMEHWGNNQNYISSALHTPSSFGNTENHEGIVNNTVSTAFHTYTMVWSPQKIEFSLDGAVYYTYAPEPKDLQNWPYIADQYILLNVAMQEPIASNFVQSPLIIDYVRVYQADSTSTSIITKNTGNPVSIYPNPVKNRINITVEDKLIDAHVKIYDLNGSIVSTFIQKDKNVDIDVSHYPAGIYFLQFEKQNQIFTHKIVKQ